MTKKKWLYYYEAPTILWCLMLAQPLNNIGPFELWIPLFGIVSHLKSALFQGICPSRFTSSLKLLLVTLKWSYINSIDRQTDRQTYRQTDRQIDR